MTAISKDKPARTRRRGPRVTLTALAATLATAVTADAHGSRQAGPRRLAIRLAQRSAGAGGGRRGRVIRQSARPGTTRPPSMAVAVTVGK